MSHTENNIEGRIAVIGMAGRFPQAKDIDAFWNNLKNAVESIQDLSDDELLAAGESRSQIENPQYVKRASILEDADKFDAHFFAYTPKEAETMDPQQRIFLELAYHALENAGYAPNDPNQRVGVFAGTSLPSYLIHNLLTHPELADHGNDLNVRLGNDKDFLTTRASYKLNLKGPSININTACSTSLVAVHTACQSLLNYQSDIALAGGITVKTPQDGGYQYQPGGISSPDGSCRAFDADAKGTIGGSGGGIVVLKRLEDALQDGDTIDAVICGSAVNNDGSNKVGYTAPSVNGQAEVIAEAQAIANFAPHTISYIEAHGTGTSLGDPIEIEALTQAFRLGSEAKGFCAIGSVKTNVGHLDAAAGVCGLIKTILSLQNQTIPASLHYKEPNPNIDFANSPFYVNPSTQAWKTSLEHPRRAGVSSFGIGGTNAHVVLEEAPGGSMSSMQTDEKAQPFILSGKTPEAVTRISKNLAEYLTNHPDVNLNQVSWTLSQGREPHNYRAAVVSENRQQLLDSLDAIKNFSLAPTTSPRISFLFTGQGSQYVNMGAGLYATEPAFKQHIDACAEIILSLTGEDLREILFPLTDGEQSMSEILKQTAVAQPALFSIEYSLAQLWMSWGIIPSVMIGHSIGEYVAACIAEVMSLESAIMLVVERGRLMQSVAPGSMMAVSLSEQAIEPHLNGKLEIAATNGLHSCVVSGEEAEIQVLHEILSDQEIPCTLLHTSHAFHSQMMEPILADYREKVATTNLQAPKIPFISNVTGNWIQPHEATSPNYWSQHLRQPVRFHQCLDTANSDGIEVFLEVGPGNTLSTLGKRHFSQSEDCKFLSSLRHPQEKTSDRVHLLNALTNLWKLGFSINWQNVYAQAYKKRIHLPGYPFERKRYWIERDRAQTTKSKAGETRGLPPKNPDVGQWFSIPSWKQQPLIQHADHPDASGKTWVIFKDQKGVGDGIQKELKTKGHAVISVMAGDEFRIIQSDDVQINYRNTRNYDQLISYVSSIHSGSIHFIHLASISNHASPDLWNKERIEEFAHQGCASVLHLGQALRMLPEDSDYRIDVITDSMQEAFGRKPRNPECATILGPVRVMPQETMNLSCRSIDIDLEEQQLPSLISELIHPNDANIILLRNGLRWIETHEAVDLPSPQHAPVRFKDDGCYLITGGYGRVGLTLANYLAERFRARIALVGRTGLPPRERWSQIQENDDHSEWFESCKPSTSQFNLKSEQPFLIEALGKISSQLKIPTQPDASEWLETAYEISAQLIYEALECSPLDTQEGSNYSKDQIIQILEVKPAYRGLIHFMLNTLEANARITSRDGKIHFTKTKSHSSSELISRAKKDFPEFSGRLEALAHCAKHLVQVMSGKISGVGVLYPDGKSSIIDRFELNPETDKTSQENIRIYFERYSMLLRDMVEKMLRSNPTKKLRILEVGAGNLKLTKILTSILADRDVEYYVTDIGRTFVNKAENHFKGAEHNYMQFEVLDISKNPADQGFEPYSFDLVVALNVIHATPNIGTALTNCKQLLAPSGLIALIETVKSEPWDNMIWGLAEDWWHFEDFDLRNDSPLISVDRWIKAYAKAGYQNISAFPEAEEINTANDCAIILGQQDDNITDPSYLTWKAQENAATYHSIQNQIKHLLNLEALGSQVLCLEADISDESQLARVISETEKHFQRIDGVIHTAGTTSGKSIFTPFYSLGAAEIESQFKPKVQGTAALHRLLNQKPMDFCLLISSNASVLGGLGLATYSASNAFMDSFVRSVYQTTKTPFISSNWDGWPKLEPAAATDTAGSQQTSIEAFAMTRHEAEVAFASIISQTGIHPQFIVSSGELRQRITASKKKSASSSRDADKDIDPVSDLAYQRPEVSTQYSEPTSETEIALTRIWQNLMGIKSIGVIDNFFELGGDSLLGTQLISRANKYFNIQLPLRSLFEELTIRNLALRIENSYLTNETSIKIEDISPIANQETYPLSFSQRRMWLVCQMSGASVAYNLKYALMLEGDIDTKSFEAAFAYLVKRHESLRTQFIVRQGEPVQFILPVETVDFKIDYRNLSENPDAESTAHSLAKSEALKPFDLANDLLIRVSLLELASHQQTKRHVMLFNMHHIISDGWSLKVLVQELSEAYNQLIKSGEASLPPLPIQYRDYAAWQNKRHSENAISSQENYWLRQLGGELPVLELPLDFPRPKIQSFAGSYLIKIIDAEKYGKLVKFNQLNNTSLYVTLLAALNITLRHHSHQDDILIGSPVAGRNRIELENQIGFYLNTVVMRNATQPEMNFGELMNRVKKTVADAFDHQDYPFDQLVEKLAIARDQSRSPLFDVMLNLVLDDEKMAINIEGLNISSFGNTSQGSLFELNFMWAQTDGRLELWLHYNTDLFKEETVMKMADGYLEILNRLITDSAALELPIGEFLTTDEKQREEVAFASTLVELSEDF